MIIQSGDGDQIAAAVQEIKKLNENLSQLRQENLLLKVRKNGKETLLPKKRLFEEILARFVSYFLGTMWMDLLNT